MNGTDDLSFGSDVFCIYHAHCCDGFGAAWIVKRQFPGAQFYAANYNEPPPEGLEGKRVYIVDFSYDYHTMLHICEVATQVTLIDHHKSALNNLRGQTFPTNFRSLLTSVNSGAMLTWQYFYPNVTPPRLIKYIEDRDLFRFDLPNSRNFSEALFSYPYDFGTWTEIHKQVETDEGYSDFWLQGSHIRRRKFKDIEELLPVLTRTMEIGGHEVPVVGLPKTYGTDAANILAYEAPFAGYYFDTPGYRQFGICSRKGSEVDVSEIAKQYGGGGHQHASGFKVPRDHPLALA